MTVEKPKPKQLLRPIPTGANSAMNQSQFLAITCNSLKAREKSRVHGAIGFGFASHWLKNWRESFKPITKCSNRNHVITFDSHLKTAVMMTHRLLLLEAKLTFDVYKLMEESNGFDLQKVREISHSNLNYSKRKQKTNVNKCNQ